MSKKVFTKVKAGLQDLLLGFGTEIQKRQGRDVVVDKIAIPIIIENTDKVAELNPEEFPFIGLVDKVGFISYAYSATSIAAVNNVGVLAAKDGIGRYLLANDYRRDQLVLRDVTESINISALDSYSYINALSDIDIVLTLQNDYNRNPIGSIIYIHQGGGLGRVNIAEGPGITINTPGSLFLRTRFSTIALICKDWNEWDLMGDIND